MSRLREGWSVGIAMAVLAISILGLVVFVVANPSMIGPLTWSPVPEPTLNVHSCPVHGPGQVVGSFPGCY